MARHTSAAFLFPAQRLIKGLSITTVTLLLVHIALTICHYSWIELPWLVRELFDVDEEESIPTWFSSCLLFITALTITLVATLSYRARDAAAAYWAILAAGFFFMSVDEIAGFHETLNSVIEFSWAVPGLIVAIIVGLGFLRFLTRLPTPIAVRFMISGAVFVGGAIGVELATEPYLYNDELDTLAYNLWTPVEEGMEMGGVILFLSALFDYMDHSWKWRFDAQSKIRK